MRNKLSTLSCSALRALAVWDGQFEHFQEIVEIFCVFSHSGCGVLTVLIYVYIYIYLYLIYPYKYT